MGFRRRAPASAHPRQDSQQLTPADRARIGFVNEGTHAGQLDAGGQVAAMQRHQYPRWNQQAFDSVIGHYHVLPEQKVGQLSRGERAGFNLALALAGAELLVLDEPTLGLDVVAKRAFLESLLYSNASRRLHGDLLLAPDGGDRARRRQPDHPRARPAEAHVGAGGLHRASATGRRRAVQGAGTAPCPACWKCSA